MALCSEIEAISYWNHTSYGCCILRHILLRKPPRSFHLQIHDIEYRKKYATEINHLRYTKQSFHSLFDIFNFPQNPL